MSDAISPRFVQDFVRNLVAEEGIRERRDLTEGIRRSICQRTIEHFGGFDNLKRGLEAYKGRPLSNVDVNSCIDYGYMSVIDGFKQCRRGFRSDRADNPQIIINDEEPATNEVEEEYIEPAMDVEEEEYVAMNEVEDEDNISDVSSQNSVENNNENIEMNVVDDDNQYDELDRQFIRANIQLNISYSLIAAAQAQTSAAMAQYAAAYAQLELLRTRVAVERDRM